jgi:hypothetical protein
MSTQVVRSSLFCTYKHRMCAKLWTSVQLISKSLILNKIVALIKFWANFPLEQTHSERLQTSWVLHKMCVQSCGYLYVNRLSPCKHISKPKRSVFRQCTKEINIKVNSINSRSFTQIMWINVCKYAVNLFKSM